MHDPPITESQMSVKDFDIDALVQFSPRELSATLRSRLEDEWERGFVLLELTHFDPPKKDRKYEETMDTLKRQVQIRSVSWRKDALASHKSIESGYNCLQIRWRIAW